MRSRPAATTPVPNSRLERRSAPGTAAEQALALYRAIFVRSTEAIAIVDPEGFYLEQNAAHERLVGYADDELRGRTPAIHLGEETFASIAAELVATGSSRRDCLSRTKDGRELIVELSSFSVCDAKGTPVCYIGIKRDVTEQRRAAAELQQKLEEQQAIYRMADAVTRACDLEEIYDVALAELQRTVHASRSSILLYDDDRVMRFKAWRGLSQEYRRAVEGHSPWSPDDPHPQAVLIPDVEADPGLEGLLPVLAREGIRAVGFIPLVNAGRLLGKFMIYFDAPHVVQLEELGLAQTIASHIAWAITRQRSDAERQRREREQRVLAEAGALLDSALDYQETLRSITRLVVPAIADWCLIDLTDERGGFTRIAAAAADPTDAPLSRRLLRVYPPRDAEHGVSRTARAGASECLSDVHDTLLVEVARDDEHLAMLRAMRIRSYICAPLVARGRTIGVLTFVSADSGRRFSAADLPLAEELARRAALAVDNARLYREAHEANRAKSQFLTTMSHELRTPLNAIGGYTELIEMGLRGPVTDEMREDLARIQRSQKHLLGLINNLLNFARVESGHVELDLQVLPVEDELAAVEPLIAPQLAAKGLRYGRTPGNASVTCRADRDKMRQVLLNLLSNAVKFTPGGGEVALAWDATEETVRVHVRDTGQGIPANQLESIFEPFVQLTNTLTRVTEGTGLGLAISRELARAMGGDITVVSQLNRGSTFTLTLPRTAAAAQ